MFPVIDVTRVIGWAKDALIWTIKWAAIRAFTISIVLTLVPLAIYNGWKLISEKLFAYVNSMAVSGEAWTGTVVEFTGLGAWLAQQLRFQECLSVIISVLMIKFALSFIKR